MQRHIKTGNEWVFAAIEKESGVVKIELKTTFAFRMAIKIYRSFFSARQSQWSCVRTTTDNGPLTTDH
jgi:hypothetical protein